MQILTNSFSGKFKAEMSKCIRVFIQMKITYKDIQDDLKKVQESTAT